MTDDELDYFDIEELVARANTMGREAGIGEISVRAVRFYVQRGLFTKGLMVSKLPDVVQRALHHKGNQRFFTPRDVQALVDIKRELDAGKTIADLGGRDARESVRSSPNDDISTRKMLFTELNAVETPFEYRDEIVVSASEPAVVPVIEDTWSITFRRGLTLHGTGPAPTGEAVRELARVVQTHIAPVDAVSVPQPTGLVKVEIELADIAERFSGAIVNSSNSSVTPGGGASARIWDACGVDELEKERQRLDAEKRLPLEVGAAVVTGAGRGASLGFEAVIHAHGPRWHDSGDERDDAAKVEELARTWRSVLHAADQSGHTRLVAPAISSGLYGFPSPLVFEVAFRTLLDTKTSVQLVRFRTVSRRGFDEMIDALQRVRRAV